MLLETRNAKKNDFVIYSRNSTDEDYNYRIIFRNDPRLHHRKIGLGQVEKLISEYFPKNLVIYRLLTNVPELKLPETNYGIRIYVDKIPELFFTDPVYAVDAIESILNEKMYEYFRFKIQQVGLISVSKYKGVTNYSEKFSIDLTANDAITQNDQLLLDELFEHQKIRKKKKAKAERDNFIFIPETKKKIKSGDKDKGVVDKKEENFIERSEVAARQERIPSYATSFEGKELPLEFKERERIEKEPDAGIITARENAASGRDETIAAGRDDQLNFRSVNENISKTAKDEENVQRYNLSDEEKTDYEDFRKVQTLLPIKLRKVEIKDDSTIVEIEQEPVKQPESKDFKKFLENIRTESSHKIKRKKKKKGKSSDILDLFKSTKNKNPDDKNNVLKIGKDKPEE